MMADAKESGKKIINELQDEFTLKNIPEVKSERWNLFPDLPREEPYIAQKVPFTRRQWAMVMLLVFTNIVVLTTLVVVVLSAG